MKILHTSDWHLGKRLMDRERLPEQIEVLEEIETVCEREGVELVLIAGDVFDTFVPPAEAEEVFFRAVKRLAKDRAVVAVSGNHDDGVRLAACSPFAESEGVYLYGNRPRVAALTAGDRAVRAVQSGENYLVLENRAGERVYLNLLPYPNEARLKEDKSEETYAEKTARWIARGEEGYRGDMPHILVAHVFAAGGKTSDGERNIDLGGARAVPVSNFPKEGYVALGHLHRRQRVGDNGLYSGSILQYAFDEANTEKSVVLLETSGNEVRVVKEIPLTKGKKLVRLECRGVADALDLLPRYEGCYVELTLHLTAPLTKEETQSLRDCNAGLVSLIPVIGTTETESVPVRAALRPEELFTVYYREKLGSEVPGELLTAFLQLLEEEK